MFNLSCGTFPGSDYSFMPREGMGGIYCGVCGIELPFYMISAEVFLPDKEQINELEQLLPSKNDSILDLLKKKRKKMPRRNRESNIEKSFDDGDFKKIKRWLES